MRGGDGRGDSRGSDGPRGGHGQGGRDLLSRGELRKNSSALNPSFLKAFSTFIFPAWKQVANLVFRKEMVSVARN